MKVHMKSWQIKFSRFRKHFDNIFRRIIPVYASWNSNTGYRERYKYIHILGRRVCINSMKTTLYLDLDFWQASNQQRHINKDKRSINNFSLLTCKIAIWKTLVRNQSILLKSRLHCIDMTAADTVHTCMYPVDCCRNNHNVDTIKFKFNFWVEEFFT